MAALFKDLLPVFRRSLRSPSSSRLAYGSSKNIRNVGNMVCIYVLPSPTNTNTCMCNYFIKSVITLNLLVQSIFDLVSYNLFIFLETAAKPIVMTADDDYLSLCAYSKQRIWNFQVFLRARPFYWTRIHGMKHTTYCDMYTHIEVVLYISYKFKEINILRRILVGLHVYGCYMCWQTRSLGTDHVHDRCHFL